MSDTQWDIRREGRAWDVDEAEDRYFSAPAKLELIDGKLYWDDEDRLRMLGLLLENVGANAALRRSGSVACSGGRAIGVYE